MARTPLPGPLTVLLAGVLAVSVAGCGEVLTASPARSQAAIPTDLRDLPTTTIGLGGRSLYVAVAGTFEARRRGLIGVDDLGALDGLLFEYPAPIDTAFHMQGVPIPLDIAFFDGAGTLLDVRRMAPCEADPCPSYRAPAPIRWAIETEAGGLAGLGPGTRLSLAPQSASPTP